MKKTKIIMQTVDGRVEMDVSKKACYPYGFFAGDEIMNPNGIKAVVVGVYKENLYYTKEGEVLPTNWRGENYKKDELLTRGFKLIKRASNNKV